MSAEANTLQQDSITGAVNTLVQVFEHPPDSVHQFSRSWETVVETPDGCARLVLALQQTLHLDHDTIRYIESLSHQGETHKRKRSETVRILTRWSAWPWQLTSYAPNVWSKALLSALCKLAQTACDKQQALQLLDAAVVARLNGPRRGVPRIDKLLIVDVRYAVQAIEKLSRQEQPCNLSSVPLRKRGQPRKTATTYATATRPDQIATDTDHFDNHSTFSDHQAQPQTPCTPQAPHPDQTLLTAQTSYAARSARRSSSGVTTPIRSSTQSPSIALHHDTWPPSPNSTDTSREEAGSPSDRLSLNPSEYSIEFGRNERFEVVDESSLFINRSDNIGDEESAEESIDEEHCSLVKLHLDDIEKEIQADTLKNRLSFPRGNQNQEFGKAHNEDPESIKEEIHVHKKQLPKSQISSQFRGKYDPANDWNEMGEGSPHLNDLGMEDDTILSNTQLLARDDHVKAEVEKAITQIAHATRLCRNRLREVQLQLVTLACRERGLQEWNEDPGMAANTRQCKVERGLDAARIQLASAKKQLVKVTEQIAGMERDLDAMQADTDWRRDLVVRRDEMREHRGSIEATVQVWQQRVVEAETLHSSITTDTAELTFPGHESLQTTLGAVDGIMHSMAYVQVNTLSAKDPSDVVVPMLDAFGSFVNFHGSRKRKQVQN